MERKTISIEPYVESGGILGTRLEVNPKAADSIMKRTAMRRNVEIRKGYGRKSISVVGSDELALRPTIKRRNVKEDDFSLTSSSFNSETLIIQVHDQALAEEVESWMQENYKKKKNGGQAKFDEMYTSKLSEEVVSRLKKSFYKEKAEILGRSFNDFVPKFCNSLGVLEYAFGAIFLVSDLVLLAKDGRVPPGANIIKNEVTSFGLGYVLFKMSDFYESLVEEQPNAVDMRGVEDKFPNPQAPSLVLGTVALTLNSGKLIRLNDSK